MEILGTEKLTDEKWVNLFVRRFRHQGKEGRWVFASRHAVPAVPASEVDAVVVVPILLAEEMSPRLVVVKEYRVPLGDYEYAFPAGIVDPGESVQQAARRELLEETGLEVIEILKVSPPTYSSAGMTDEAVVIVFATARAPANLRQNLQDSEDIEVLLLDVAQVSALCNSSVKVNARAWPIFFMYQQLGRFL